MGLPCREQGPGLHGESGHQVRRYDEGSVVALGAGPEGAFLQWREENGRAIGGESVVAPEGAKPGIPVIDRWRGPDAVARGTLRFCESEVQSTRGTGTGSDDGGAAPERISDGPGQCHRGSSSKCKLA